MKIQFFTLCFLFGKILLAQTFTYSDQPFLGVEYASIQFADVDGDGDQDVLICGIIDDLRHPYQTVELYINDGAGNFSRFAGPPFFNSYFGYWCHASFADVDGDHDLDLMTTGRNTMGMGNLTRLFTNDGLGNFTEVQGTSFESFHFPWVSFGDVDGDKDMDVLLSEKLYLNNGNGIFSESSGIPENDGKSAFADVDGDHDLDVVFLVVNPNNYSTKLFLNDGFGTFNEATDTPFESVIAYSLAFADIDADGDQDVIFASGTFNSNERFVRLYTNDGLGKFEEVIQTPFEDVLLGSVAFADADNDNDQDVLIAGWSNSNLYHSTLYTNDGRGNFTKVQGTPFEGVFRSGVAFADVDGDNDADVIISGLGQNSTSTKLYLNESLRSGIFGKANEPDFEYSLHPNPVGKNTLQVSLYSEKNRFIDTRIFDLNGRLMMGQQYQLLPGQQSILTDISNLVKGIYFIQLNDGIRTGTQKFIVH